MQEHPKHDLLHVFIIHPSSEIDQLLHFLNDRALRAAIRDKDTCVV